MLVSNEDIFENGTVHKTCSEHNNILKLISQFQMFLISLLIHQYKWEKKHFIFNTPLYLPT